MQGLDPAPETNLPFAGVARGRSIQPSAGVGPATRWTESSSTSPQSCNLRYRSVSPCSGCRTPRGLPDNRRAVVRVHTRLLVLQSNSPFSALSRQALTFKSLPVTVASDAQSVTLSNGGGAPLALNGISITGSNAADFAESDTCPATLTSGASCTISVTFTPTVSGTVERDRLGAATLLLATTMEALREPVPRSSPDAAAIPA
jgi:hypothetical protein